MLRVIARPRNGISRAQATARLATLWPRLVEGSPFAEEFSLPPDLRLAATGWTDLRRQFRLPLLVLMAVVGMVLLISCANVANLLMARASTRQREMALRLAIGASRGRIVRQLLTESVLLSGCGGALGIALAWFGSGFLVELLSSGPAGRIDLDVAPHGHVLLFATVVAVATAILFGVAPAFRATGGGPAAALKNSPAQFSGPRTRLGPGLVVFQVALSMTLLIGAGLFLGTLRNLRHFDAGFRHEGVLLVDLKSTRAGLEGARLGAVYREVLEKVGHLPGVASASLSNMTVLSGGRVMYGASVTGSSSGSENVDLDRIGPRYFETLRTPVLEGREFTMADDRIAARVAVVNEALARHFFPEGHAVGRNLSIEGTTVPVRIVGVV
jgi:putative ABC transport system permease protein